MLKKIPIWKNVLLILSTLLVIIIATLAWFYTGTYADANDFTVSVGKATYVQVSGDEGQTWEDDLDVQIGINQCFKEISGNGIAMFSPAYEVVQDELDGSYNMQIVSFDALSDGKLYYEQVFDFRSDTMQNITLEPESFVTAVEGDYIDGAIRLAFFEIDEDGNETLKFIWAPNSTVEYASETDSYTREGAVEAYYYYQKSVYPVQAADLTASSSDVAVISTEGTDENGCGYNATYKFLWSSGQCLPAQVPCLLTLDEDGDDGHYHKTLKVRVWLEGHDRECVSHLSGQKFTIGLEFAAQEVE